MSNYTAFTIGPITSSLQKARNTRGVWGSSFLFSHLMKSIIQALDDGNKKFVIPLVSQKAIFDNYDGAGLFPDRFIYQSTPGGIGELTKAIGDVVLAFTADPGNLDAVKWGFREESKDNDRKSDLSKATAEGFRKFLFDYLVLYAVELEVVDGENVIEHCNVALSRLELQQPLMPPYELDYLHYFLLGVQKSAMYKEALLGNRFPSLIEIATEELRKIPVTTYPPISDGSDEEDEDDFIKKLKAEYTDKFLRRHKYIAIVKADGDRLGKTVEQIYKQNPSVVKEVDEILLNFNIAAVEIIKSHGGRAVYVGGDDLLFFAPLGYQGASVFHLIETLSVTYKKAFDNFFKEKINLNPDFWKTDKDEKVKPPTLSFGLSISYYKYPLFEALEDVDKMLKTAKSAAGERKNALTFCIRKHSGQTFGATFFKDTTTYTSEFTALVSMPTVEDDNFLSSVQQHLLQFETSLSALLSVSDIKDVDPLAGYFDNHFNEPDHDRYRDFLNTVKNMVWAAYREREVATEALIQVFATLRFLQFYNQPDSDD